MRAVETALYNGTNLSVYVESDEHDKATVKYFINGYEVTEWGKLKPVFQGILTAIADDICRGYNLTKWNY